MRIYDANGVLKDSASSGASASGSRVLASGTIDPLSLDADGIAQDQELGATLDDDGIALAQAPTATVALTLTAAAASLIPARLLSLTSAADLSLINFEVIGVNKDGSDVSEIIAGPNNNTVLSTEFYSEITSITPDGTDAGTLTAGWPVSATEMPLVLHNTAFIFSPTRRVSLTSLDDLSGLTFTVEGTDENDAPQTEEITGPNVTTSTGTLQFKTVTLITPDAVSAGSVAAGWVAENAPMLIATQDLTLSHIFLSNDDQDPQEVTLYLRIGGSTVTWKLLDMNFYHSISVLNGESPVPLAEGDAIFATASEAGKVHYVIHGV